MNKIYKTKYSHTINAWVVVSEITKGEGKTSSTNESTQPLRQRLQHFKTTPKTIIQALLMLAFISLPTIGLAAWIDAATANGQTIAGTKFDTTGISGATLTFKEGIGIKIKKEGATGPKIDQSYIFSVDTSKIKPAYIGIQSTTTSATNANEDGEGATGADAMAIGKSAAASQDSAIALGKDTTASVASGVALGAESVADRAAIKSNDVKVSATATGVDNKVFAFENASSADKQAIKNTVKGNLGAFSVGNAGATRQIINVAAGSADTDAVNVAQLKASQIHYFSVNSTGSGNYHNDGATGTGAMAIGRDAVANEKGVIAMGQGAGKGTIRNNKNKGGQGDGSIYLGNNAGSYGNHRVNNYGEWGSVFIGEKAGAYAKGDANIAMGSAAGNNHEGSQNIFFGDTAKPFRKIVIIKENDNEATQTSGNRNIVFGNQYIDGSVRDDEKNKNNYINDTIIIGNRAVAENSKSIAIGSSNDPSYDGIKPKSDAAIGAYAKGERSIAIGVSDVDNQDGAQAFGNDSIALGTNAKVVREVGPNATEEEKKAAEQAVKNAIALGKNTTASVASGVALGAESVADRAAIQNVGVSDTATGVDNKVFAFENASSADKQAIKNTVKGNLGAFSVGNAGATRQIINVAAGSADTDAVNVAQLKASQIHYFSVNSTGGGNYNNDGATGADAIAIGKDAQATANSVISIGNNAGGLKQDGTSNLIPNTATNQNGASIYLGNNAGSGGNHWVYHPMWGSIFIGQDAGKETEGDANLGIGSTAGSNHKGSQNIFFGDTAKPYKKGQDFYDPTNNKKANKTYGNRNIIFGNQYIDGAVRDDEKNENNYINDTIIIGNRAVAEKSKSIAIGSSNAPGDTQAAAGAYAKGERSIAIGVSDVDNQDGAQAFGNDSIALGTNAKVVREVDPNATEEEKKAAEQAVKNAVALGKNATASVASGVALGAESVADRAAIKSNDVKVSATANAANNEVFAFAHASDDAKDAITATVKGELGAFSVGNAGATRQIINVAAGSADTDAVNVAQLKSVANIASSSLTFTGNINADTDADGTQQKLGSTLKIIGSKKAVTFLTEDDSNTATEGTYSAKNLQTVVTDGQIQIQMAENPEFTSIKIGDATNNTTLTSTADGLDVGKDKITNVADGKADGDAVNLGQLKKYRTTVQSSDGSITVNQTNTDGTFTYDIKVNAQGITNSAQLPVVYTKAGGTRVYKRGNKFYDAEENGNEVVTGDIIVSMQNAAGSTTDATTLTNIKGNLTGANGTPAPTTSATKPNDLKENNAATVGDVLNAGFNLQGNGIEDFVKAYDTVNFVNGQGTTATVETDGTVTKIAYDVATDNKTLTIIGTDDNGNTVYQQADGSYNTAADGTGTKVQKDKVKNAKVAANTTSLTIADGTDPQKPAGQVVVNDADKGALATAGGIADAINNSGFTIKANSDKGTPNKMIQPSNTLTIQGATTNTDFNQSDAGQNIFTQVSDDDTITIGLAKKLKGLEEVQTGQTTMNTSGVTITTNTPVDPTKPDGDKVTISLTDKGLDNGGNKITNVADGSIAANSKDAVNGGQLFDIQQKLGTGKLTFAGDMGNSYEAALGSIITIQGGAKTELSDNNIGVVSNGSGILTVKLAKNLTGLESVTANSVTAGTGDNQVVLNNKGVNVGGSTYINNAGINANDKTITNVADGNIAEGSKDAVNGGQLHAVTQTYFHTGMGDLKTADENGNNKGLITDRAGAVGDNSLTAGVNAIAKGENAAALGFGAKAEATSSVALGHSAQVTDKATHGVALGAGSVADRAAIKSTDVKVSATADAAQNEVFAFANASEQAQKAIKATVKGELGAVSVGNQDANRQITGVAAGSADNDAVNVAQLKAVTSVVGKGTLTFAADSGDPHEAALGSTVNIKGGSNIHTSIDGDTVRVSLSDHVRIHTLSASGTVVNGDGIIIQGGPSMTRSGGINAAGHKIINVAPGEISPTSTDAVNGAQLHQLAQQVDGQIGDVDGHASAGTASAIASAGLPMAYLPGKSMVGAAIGTYRGKSAVAVGVSAISDNGKWVLKGSASANTYKNVSMSVGVGFQW